jgi:sugar phosphate isomerase/epimerase
MNRREFLAAGAGVAGWVNELRAAAPLKVGMADWSLGRRDATVFELAKQCSLDGVQVDMGRVRDGMPLRRPEVRQQYRDAARAAGLTVPSTNIGEFNNFPLADEPRSVIWLLDSIEMARDLGARISMVPFFGRGELKENNAPQIDRLVDLMKEAAPLAEKAGLVFGLENTLSADANMRILDRVGSPALKVYYDVGNSSVRNYDVPAEIRALGSRICEFHIKDGRNLLGQGRINFEAIAAAIRDIQYRGWLTLETATLNDAVTTTKANAAYARKILG